MKGLRCERSTYEIIAIGHKGTMAHVQMTYSWNRHVHCSNGMHGKRHTHTSVCLTTQESNVSN